MSNVPRGGLSQKISHRSLSFPAQVPCPRSMARYEKHTEYVHQPVCEAGDGAWLCSLSLCRNLPRSADLLCAY
jgi:hypothetical protein